jgi:His/Glu/Gln/Arg/opine family amino acid ABC transporter permease subunit
VFDLDWSIIARYREAIVSGLLLALRLTAAGFAIGTVIGLLVAFARISGKRWLSGPAAVYVETIRNVPLLLLVLIFYFGMPMFAYRSLPDWLADLIVFDGVGSMILALSIYYGTYLSEVFRAGILSVGTRYLDAGRAIGLSGTGIARYITLPIMFRTVLPSLTNTAISLFKDTSIAMAIAVPELTFAARKISTDTFKVFEAWFTVGAIYLVVSWLIALAMRWMERRIKWSV